MSEHRTITVFGTSTGLCNNQTNAIMSPLFATITQQLMNHINISFCVSIAFRPRGVQGEQDVSARMIIIRVLCIMVQFIFPMDMTLNDSLECLLDQGSRAQPRSRQSPTLLCLVSRETFDIDWFIDYSFHCSKISYNRLIKRLIV